jgi:8-oxo-dGTP pyrophosphatase MutT (NUDIX family)
MYSYNQALKSALIENLENFNPRRLEDSSLTHAAVALTVISLEGQAALILTKRSGKLRAHSGQWAIPGGRLDENETRESAALRELHEEVGLDLADNQVMGVLDDYQTRSGYIITPVVIWAGIDAHRLKPNPREVASIHPMSFQELTRPDGPILETIEESEHTVLAMPFEDDRIYAPTAAMLYQFREVVILGRQTRVAHFDQPVFAWK